MRGGRGIVRLIYAIASNASTTNQKRGQATLLISLPAGPSGAAPHAGRGHAALPSRLAEAPRFTERRSAYNSAGRRGFNRMFRSPGSSATTRSRGVTQSGQSASFGRRCHWSESGRPDILTSDDLRRPPSPTIRPAYHTPDAVMPNRPNRLGGCRSTAFSRAWFGSVRCHDLDLGMVQEQSE